jgi:hypothetical protein
MGFAGPTPVFMRFWVPVVDGCFVLLRSGWCPRGAPGSHFTSVTLRALTRGCADTPPHTFTVYRQTFEFGSEADHQKALTVLRCL